MIDIPTATTNNRADRMLKNHPTRGRPRSRTGPTVPGASTLHVTAAATSPIAANTHHAARHRSPATNTSPLATTRPTGEPALTSARARRIPDDGTWSSTASENGAHVPPALVPAVVIPTASSSALGADAVMVAPTASSTSKPLHTSRSVLRYRLTLTSSRGWRCRS